MSMAPRPRRLADTRLPATARINWIDLSRGRTKRWNFVGERRGA